MNVLLFRKRSSNRNVFYSQMPFSIIYFSAATCVKHFCGVVNISITTFTCITANITTVSIALHLVSNIYIYKNH